MLELDPEQLRLLDIDSYYDPDGSDEEQGSIRRPILVEPLAGGDPIDAETHFDENDTERYLKQIHKGRAEMVPCYTLAMATGPPKQCCIDDPAHKSRHSNTGRPTNLHTISTEVLCVHGGMDSNGVIEAVQKGSIPKVEDRPHYAIYDCVVKEYPAATFFVQSSGTPINLGRAMQPWTNTETLWEFVDEHCIAVKENAPQEVYLYNWVKKAQGPMVFDVSVVVEDDMEDVENEHGFVVKRYPPMKFASIIYHGPFPNHPKSGWDNIRWDERAEHKGLVYTERLYRELYHQYDFENNWHITEIQIEVE